MKPHTTLDTNAYVGLKAGDDPTGRFPGADDPEFRAWRRNFLEEQITVMQPRAVATIGSDARRLVAGMAPELADWHLTSSILNGCDVSGPLIPAA